MRARVSATYLYPVKACAPLPVASLAFTAAGDIRGDREWVVVDADDRITWSGAIPTLCQIIPAGTPDRLAITSTAGDSVFLPPPDEGAARTVHGWNGSRQAFDALEGRDAGDTVAELASTIAGQRIRLVHLATTAHRPNAAHLISDSSLAVLAGQLGRPADWQRFRPNLVLTGDGGALPPFVEEQAAALTASDSGGRLKLSVTGPCERCIVVNVDPASGAVDGHFLKTTAAHSRTRRGAAPPCFGVYARATTPGTLTRGDRLELVLPRDLAGAYCGAPSSP